MAVNGPRFASKGVNYDTSKSTSTNDASIRFCRLLANVSGAAVQTGVSAAGGPLSIAAGAISGAVAGGAATGDMSQSEYLAKMEEMQNKGAALQYNMWMIQERSQQNSATWQGMSNTSKTIHDTQLNTVRNVKA